MNNRWRGLKTVVKDNYNWSQVSSESWTLDKLTVRTRFIFGSLDTHNYQFGKITMKFLTKALNDLGKYFISYDCVCSQLALIWYKTPVSLCDSVASDCRKNVPWSGTINHKIDEFKQVQQQQIYFKNNISNSKRYYCKLGNMYRVIFLSSPRHLPFTIGHVNCTDVESVRCSCVCVVSLTSWLGDGQRPTEDGLGWFSRDRALALRWHWTIAHIHNMVLPEWSASTTTPSSASGMMLLRTRNFMNISTGHANCKL